MTRSATTPVLDALAAQVVRPVLLFEGQFASGWLRLWTGVGDLIWSGQTWTGAGQLLAIGALAETSEIVASGTTVTLSGVPTAGWPLVSRPAGRRLHRHLSPQHRPPRRWLSVRLRRRPRPAARR